ncbi:MAG TPA: DUF3261 domain-containing protein [Nevskiaceae bacterium]|nr:DUF3261 domain-containing protein [Nevskiaceae bacterium]
MKRAVAGAVCLLLGACATRPSAPPGPSLLPPSVLGRTQTAQQVLHVAFRDRQAVIQGVLVVDAAEIRFVALDATGQRLFGVRYDGATSTVEPGRATVDDLPPERLLADVQLAYWPLPALQAAAKDGWTYAEPAPQTRRLTRDGRLVAEVHYASPMTAGEWPRQLWISNFESGYALSIRSEPLP